MRKFFMLALIAVSMLTISCGKNSDDTQTENARLVGTWKCVKLESIRNGKRVSLQEVKDDGCSRYVFTDKILTTYYPEKGSNECIGEEKPYRIENGRIHYKEYDDEKNAYEEYSFGFKFIDNDTFEFFEDTAKITNVISIYKRVK
ncbi:hypothetical protein [Capnocytophaga cynodegmi]|uniref:hypothetical protein n=1 Tax=Capnocytophaga cynodegmi TaxID=28189 RepID=UPI003858BC5A